MAGENKLEGKREEGAVEAKAGISAEKAEDTPVKIKAKAASCQKEAKDDTFKPWGPLKGGCCR